MRAAQQYLGERRALAMARWCEMRGQSVADLARLANHSRHQSLAMLSVERARWIVAYVRRQPREVRHER